jgi:hypothetical protein
LSAKRWHRPSACVFLLCACLTASAHDVITTKVTYSREISRLIYKHCAACHREGGSSFSLTSYEQARPWAKAIKEEVLERRMPPWDAVKGFGSFKNDEGLTQEQIELITDWVEGGAPEGDPKLLPQFVAQVPDLPGAVPSRELIVDGRLTLKKPATVIGIRAKTLLEGTSVQVMARKPDGAIEPLIWLYKYHPQFDRPYYFRSALQLPAGTKIEAFPASAGTISLLIGGTGLQPVFSTSTLKPVH